MAYDDAKTFHGRAYSGMRVGGEHHWIYPDGRWRERKVAPDKWDVSFRSTKRRRRSAPVDSGAAPGTMFHWYVLAHQRVRKIDQDTYATFLEGTKWKVGHRRPHWRRWSSEYDDQTPARQRVAQILEETLRELRRDETAGARPLETLLDPAVEHADLPDGLLPEQLHLGEFDPDPFLADG